MDGSLKSIQTQSCMCLEDGICKICRAPFQLGGALKEKTKLPVWVCWLPGRNAKCLYPRWEVEKAENNNNKITKGASLEFVPLLFCIPLVWRNISMFLPGWLLCCLKIAGAFRWWLYIKSGRWRHPPAFEPSYSRQMSLSGGTGRQEKQGLGPRSFDSSESKTGHFLRETDLMILLNFSLTRSEHYRRKKRSQHWGNIWGLQQTWKDIGSMSKYLTEMMHEVHLEE